MTITAKNAKELSIHNRRNIHDVTIDNAIIYAAMKGNTSIEWEGDLPREKQAEIISAGFSLDFKTVGNKQHFIIDWNNVEVEG